MTSWVWNKMPMDADPASVTVCVTLSEYLSFPKALLPEQEPEETNINLQGLL